MTYQFEIKAGCDCGTNSDSKKRQTDKKESYWFLSLVLVKQMCCLAYSRILTCK